MVEVRKVDDLDGDYWYEVLVMSDVLIRTRNKEELVSYLLEVLDD